MKAYYILFHFGSEGNRIYVSGILSPAENEEEGLKKAIESVKKSIDRHQARLDANTCSQLVPSFEGELNRHKEYLYSLEHPDEINTRGRKLVEITEITQPADAGH